MKVSKRKTKSISYYETSASSQSFAVYLTLQSISNTKRTFGFRFGTFFPRIPVTPRISPRLFSHMSPIQQGKGKFLLASFTPSITLWSSSDPFACFNTHVLESFVNRKESRIPFLSEEKALICRGCRFFLCVCGDLK
jgi:hypothetical protein